MSTSKKESPCGSAGRQSASATRRALGIGLLHAWPFAAYALLASAAWWPPQWHRCGHHPRVMLLLLAGAGLGTAWLVLGLPTLHRWMGERRHGAG